MDINLKSCTQCSRLFAPGGAASAAMETGPDLCAHCIAADDEDMVLIEAVVRGGIRTPRAISRQTGIPIDKVKRALKTSQLLAHETLPGDLCSSCEENLVQPGSEFCLSCRLAFHKSFGDMLTDLKEKPYVSPQHRSGASRMQGLEGVNAKRRRTGSQRIDTSAQWAKKYTD